MYPHEWKQMSEKENQAEPQTNVLIDLWKDSGSRIYPQRRQTGNQLPKTPNHANYSVHTINLIFGFGHHSVCLCSALNIVDTLRLHACTIGDF